MHQSTALGVGERVSIFYADLIAVEAAFDVVHPPCRIWIGVGTCRNTLEGSEDVHVQVNRRPSVCITKVGLDLTTGALKGYLASAPVANHLSPESLV